MVLYVASFDHGIFTVIKLHLLTHLLEFVESYKSDSIAGKSQLILKTLTDPSGSTNEFLHQASNYKPMKTVYLTSWPFSRNVLNTNF